MSVGDKRPCWRSPDSNSVASHLKEKLRPSIRDVIYKGGFKYPSMEMNVGIDVQSLETFAPQLHAGVELDPRGGIYKQADVEEALDSMYAEDEVKDFVTTMIMGLVVIAVQGLTTWATFIRAEAYRFRVMLAHMRIKKKVSTSCTTKMPPKSARRFCRQFMQ